MANSCLERYYDVDVNDTHNPRSVGKTFASAMLGIALEQGHIESLDRTLADFYTLDDYDNPSDVEGIGNDWATADDDLGLRRQRRQHGLAR